MTGHERTGWRDHDLSQRHRRWGFHSPAADIDFLLVEYSFGLPVALVDYKHHRAAPVDLEHPTYRALRHLADRAPAVPFLIARYWPGSWAFHVIAANSQARATFGVEAFLSEVEFVAALHDLRSLTLQANVARALNTERPPIHQPQLRLQASR